jgi:hypothetical protein
LQRTKNSLELTTILIAFSGPRDGDHEEDRPPRQHHQPPGRLHPTLRQASVRDRGVRQVRKPERLSSRPSTEEADHRMQRRQR